MTEGLARGHPRRDPREGQGGVTHGGGAARRRALPGYRSANRPRSQGVANEEVMRVVSVNVGLPRTVRWKGRDVTAGIFKEPVEDRVPLRRLNLDGDRQADLSVHGGAATAVCAYPLEHYAFWREELGKELAFGAFGENLTVEGLPLEEEVAVGDRFRVGPAELVVTQPRLPCYKLGLRFGREDIVKRFLASRRTGYYLAVEVEGDVGAGDHVETVARDPAPIPVAEITRVYTSDRDDRATIERLIARDALPEDWRSYFEEQLAKTPRRQANSSADEEEVQRQPQSAMKSPGGRLRRVCAAGSSAGRTRTTTRRASSTPRRSTSPRLIARCADAGDVIETSISCGDRDRPRSAAAATTGSAWAPSTTSGN